MSALHFEEGGRGGRMIREVPGRKPRIHPGAYIDPAAQIIGDVVRFTLAFNPGAAFSMSVGDKSRYFFGGLAVVALVVLWWLYRTTKSGDWVRVAALGLAWGGAAGNLIDRFRGSRGVVDFIDIGVGTVRFWTFNVADSAVTIGALTLAFVLWREDREKLALAAGEAAMRDEASTGAR